MLVLSAALLLCFTYMFCLVISACMFTLFKHPSKVSALARVAQAEVGCYIWYQSIRFTRFEQKVFKTYLLKNYFQNQLSIFQEKSSYFKKAIPQKP